MINIIAPKHFKTFTWKNGLGETIELAINSGGTLNSFDWRLIIASVVEDGAFCKFTDYTRNLILIEGNGLNLQHNDSKIDKLTNILDMVTFDGGNKTVGNLHSGEITCFNIITRTECFQSKVVIQNKAVNHPLEKADLCFVYSLYRDAELVISESQETIKLPACHLLKINNMPKVVTDKFAHISGTHLIIVYLFQK